MRGLITGLVTASATAGALVGFGLRAGMPVRAYNVLATVVIGDQARGVWGWMGRVTLVGIAVHLALMVGWGLLFAAIAREMRGWHLAAAAAGVALGAWLVMRVAVLHRVGPDAAEVLGPAQLVALHIVMAVALGVGMRFALSAVERRDSDGLSKVM